MKTPAGLPRLFKSALDWNLYSSLQHEANDRKVRRCSGSGAQTHVLAMPCGGCPQGSRG